MKLKKSIKKLKLKKLLHTVKPLVWFFIGVTFASFCIATFFLLYFRFGFKDHIIPGVFIGNEYIGEKTPDEVKALFDKKNKKIANAKITLFTDTEIATISAQDLNIGYDSELLSKQADTLGKSANIFSNVYHIVNSYLYGINLKPAYKTDLTNLEIILEPIQKKEYIEPVNAEFSIENNRVVTFKESVNGRDINFQKLQEDLEKEIPLLISGKEHAISIKIPITVTEPEITTSEVNNFGIIEVIGVGTSSFAHSIPNRIHNVALAANRINGILVAPDEEFSFAKYLGDVSKFTGYKEAYVISGGKTVLGDGGGVCQVSTTLFRAILNAGLPVTERHAHAYRVGYYEQDSAPGIDATVYVPSVDLKFKNDTGHHILIQSYVNQNNQTMAFTLYGTKDGREVSMTQPVISSQTPAPEPLYQDDPTLPAGVTKQIDYAAAGAKVSFSRTVTKNGKVIINETYNSNYRPWQAVFLRGTQS